MKLENIQNCSLKLKVYGINYLGRVYYNWQQTFPDLPFIEELRRAFRHTWVGYNMDW